jgi:hypothetical protein
MLRVTGADGSVRILEPEVVADETESEATVPVEEELDAADAMDCPKCGQRQRKAVSCRRCGLLAEHMHKYEDEHVVPEVFAGLWKDVEANWDDDSVHERFVDSASAAGQLAFAARVYRKRGGERASQMLDRIVRMTEATMASGSREAVERKSRRLVVVVAVFFVVAAATVAWTWMRAGAGSEPSQKPGKTLPRSWK